jgi:hypothetical protein
MSSTTEAEGHRETSPDRRPVPQLVETGGEDVICAVIAILAGGCSAESGCQFHAAAGIQNNICHHLNHAWHAGPLL